MEKVLVMTFLTTGGNKTSLRLKGVNSKVEENTVSTAMDKIIEKNIFDTSTGDLKIKDSASVVTTTTEELAL